MSQWWSQDFRCTQCEHAWDQVVLRTEKENPIPCEKCGLMAMPTFGMPKPLRKSYHDGVKRRGFKELAEAATLESRMFELPVEKRADLQKEIDGIKKVTK